MESPSAPAADTTRPIERSFCGRPQDEPRRLVAGPTPTVAICEDCVRLCAEIFAEP
jgi:hypothetical protein